MAKNRSIRYFDTNGFTIVFEPYSNELTMVYIMLNKHDPTSKSNPKDFIKITKISTNPITEAGFIHNSYLLMCLESYDIRNLKGEFIVRLDAPRDHTFITQID